MSKHKPGTIWMLRPAGQYPNGCVETVRDGKLVIEYSPDRTPYESVCFRMPRADARLLAKRIMECLEATK